MSRWIRSGLTVVVAALLSWLLPGTSLLAAAAPHLAPQAYAYDGHHHAAPVNDTAPERGPPVAHDSTRVRTAVDDPSMGAPGIPHAARTPVTHDYDHLAPLVLVAGVAPTTSAPEQATRAGFSSVVRANVAAKSGVPLGPGVTTRKINWRPNAADPNWGLTGTHVNKHLFGSSKYALNKIDPGGNADIWRGYIQDLARRPGTGTTSNGMLDIVGTFPRTGGGGSFRLGIRLSPDSDGSFDLITLLTKQ